MSLLAMLALAAGPADALQERIDEVLERVVPAYVFFPGGSGVVISEDGYILTNHHVAGSQESTTVNLPDGRRLRVQRVCTDAVGDVALFKTDEDGPYPYATLGDSDAVREGEYSIAIGNPFGYGNEPNEDRGYYPTVSIGLVSATHRRQQTYFDCIQTDAAVNPGNSGGPLFNLDGEVIGINGRIATRFGARVNTGVGFAISASQIRRFLPRMMEGGTNGEIQHGRISGLSILRRSTGGAGPQVSSVTPDSRAAEAGFQPGDRLVRVDDYGTPTWQRFEGTVGSYPEGAALTVTVVREGGEVAIPVTLGPWREETEGATATRPRGSGYVGILIEQVEDRPQITQVMENSPAARAGLQVGDVITRLQGIQVSDADTVRQRLWRFRPGNTITLTIERNGEELQFEITLARHPQD